MVKESETWRSTLDHITYVLMMLITTRVLHVLQNVRQQSEGEPGNCRLIQGQGQTDPGVWFRVGYSYRWFVV